METNTGSGGRDLPTLLDEKQSNGAEVYESKSGRLKTYGF